MKLPARLFVGLLLALTCRVTAASAPPNIVFILADDLGWCDPGFAGSDFHETPNLDRLAAQGMVFTDAYANAANCAPSRAAIMSGQYAPRTGVYTVGSPDRGKARHRALLTPPNRRDLDGEVVTLAEILRSAGYVTAAMGKWHLGDDPASGPAAHGFDVNVAGNRRGHPASYFSPYRNPDLQDGPEGEHLTTRLTDEAIAFVEASRERRFFLYLSYYAVHTPLQPEPERLAKYRDKPPGDLHGHARYAALVEGLDANVGRLLGKLDELELSERTLVVFTSDNGGLAPVTRMSPLRGSKGMFYEGGIRVPQVVRWPGRVAPGSTCSAPVIGLDLYPTFAEIAGAALGAQPVDGASLVPLLDGAQTLEREALYWHFPAYLEAAPALGVGRWRTTPCGAIRRGDEKLIEFFEDGRLELYDLEADPGETTNLAADRPQRAEALRAELAAWRERTGAPVPAEPNPRYRPDAQTATLVASETPRTQSSRPNIIYILADDLGYAEVGCYGQTKISTPNIDRLAAEGVRFTQHYAGNSVCAPSRCVLMTGRHPGRAYIRNNRGRPVVGQEPIPAGTRTIARRLSELGYTTGCMGKWGLGGPGTTGLPNSQGFDHFFGYLDQWNAHSHYPEYLWRDDEKIVLEGNANGGREQHSQDLVTAEALDFIRTRKDGEPFFLYVPYAIPHVSLHVPEGSLAEYAGRWPETPYAGGHYSGHATPRAAYAAMVSHMDRDIGRILDLLRERGLDESTIVIFSSDNGPSSAGGADPKFFESAKPLRGLKGNLFEGGIRVPLVARWPGRIPAGSVSAHVSAFWDMYPTFVELAGGAATDDVDGISIAAALLGRGDEQREHEALYWERGRAQAVRAGDWKLVRRTGRDGETKAMLFDLGRDIGEKQDLASENPDVLARMVALARSMRTPSTVFPSVYDEPVFRSTWRDEPDRRWVGADHWANRLQDWRVHDGRLECVETRHLPMRTVHLLTHRVADPAAGFAASVRTGLVEPAAPALGRDGASGFLVGVGGAEMDHRAAAIVHGMSGRGAGVFAGIGVDGRLFIRDNERPAPAAEKPAAPVLPSAVRLSLEARPRDDGALDLVLEAREPERGHRLDRVTARFPADRLVGNIALVSHPGRKESGDTAARFWFTDWSLDGPGVDTDPSRAVGPIVSSQYTLSHGVLKLTAQLVPLGESDARTARLQVRDGDAWRTVAKTEIIRPGFTAPFRVEGWDDSRDRLVRVAYALRDAGGTVRTATWDGTVRRNPEDQQAIVLAAFTGNHNNAHDLAGGWGASDPSKRGDWVAGMWFPHADIVSAVRHHDPDVLFFSGDQVYEGASPTFADRRNRDLDYLYKWFLWCWAYRDLTRAIPAVTIPDDHDVFQGNLWGHGGRPARNQNDGGYVHPADFVKMVERTQTSHLPDPYDPTPIDQGIGVYYTALNWGRISFAIIEDRKFKSGCTDERLPPSGTGRTDHFNDPAFDTAKLDVPGLMLLGERQLGFLEAWADDWRRTDMKIALSQTIFANMATHHGKGLAPLVADLDSNGWPQTGRDRAVALLRKAFAPHVGGDQHLATLVQHGIDDHRDAVWSFCVPSVANFYPRQWLPPRVGANRRRGEPEWTGDHVDGFGNRVTVHAATNPGPSGRKPANLHDRMPGYGIVRMDKPSRTYTFECWPRYADPDDPATGGQYEGWPLTIHQLDNDGRPPVAFLPMIEVRGLPDAVVRVIDESTGEIIRTMRLQRPRWLSRVRGAGPYTIEVGCPDRGVWKRMTGLRPIVEDAAPLTFDFGF